MIKEVDNLMVIVHMSQIFKTKILNQVSGQMCSIAFLYQYQNLKRYSLILQCKQCLEESSFDWICKMNWKKAL